MSMPENSSPCSASTAPARPRCFSFSADCSCRTPAPSSINGADMRRDPVSGLRGLGIVFQDSTLDLDLPVSSSLYFHAGLHGLPRAAAKARMAEELEPARAWRKLDDDRPQAQRRQPPPRRTGARADARPERAAARRADGRARSRGAARSSGIRRQALQGARTRRAVGDPSGGGGRTGRPRRDPASRPGGGERAARGHHAESRKADPVGSVSRPDREQGAWPAPSEGAAP